LARERSAKPQKGADVISKKQKETNAWLAQVGWMVAGGLAVVVGLLTRQLVAGSIARNGRLSGRRYEQVRKTALENEGW
jgi:hypothetical protein